MLLLTRILLIIVCVVVAVLAVYVMLYTRYDERAFLDEYERRATELYDGPLSALLNGSGINNIPRLKISTTNPDIAQANSCDQGPVYIGEGIATDSDCVRTCANSRAHALNIEADEIVTHNSIILQKGAHCMLGERPRCNMRTSIAMITVNSVVCRSKFPNLVGGELGTTVVACNNGAVYDPRNVLWDAKRNARFDPLLTTVVDEDERLPHDGSYRFVCRFDGTDSSGNRYTAHPRARFHPFRNYCASAIYRAHPDVRTVWSEDGASFTCDCGDEKVTRVKHLYPDDPSSLCAHVSAETRDDVGERKILTVPYRCFTLFSTLDEVARYVPCPSDQLTREGSRIATVELEITDKQDALIEHPRYEDFKKGATVFNNWVIY